MYCQLLKFIVVNIKTISSFGLRYYQILCKLLCDTSTIEAKGDAKSDQNVKAERRSFIWEKISNLRKPLISKQNAIEKQANKLIKSILKNRSKADMEKNDYDKSAVFQAFIKDHKEKKTASLYGLSRRSVTPPPRK